MFSFKEWLIAEEDKMDSVRRDDVPDHCIHIDMPTAQQQRNYSCGAACLRAVCKHFKVGPETEKEFMSDCETTYKKGTHPDDLARAGKEYGLQVRAKKKMTVAGLKKYLSGGVPVICAMQAWGTPEDYEEDASGHYVVAVGYDGDHIYFMDPLLKSGCRGHLKASEFVSRWHDVCHKGNGYPRFGIAMWRNTADRHTRTFDKSEKID